MRLPRLVGVAAICLLATGCHKDESASPEGMPAAARSVLTAAEGGDAAAQFALANMYYSANGVEQNLLDAAAWMRKAAEQGHILAAYQLGLMLASGEGVQRDMKEAVQWWKQAATQGNVDAQYKLGATFSEAVNAVIAPDYASAAQWFQQAAEQGHELAELELATLYYNGKGVPQQFPAALEWYRKAADQGNALAAFHLGAMYFDGDEGIPQDDIEAYRWLSIASTRAAGDDDGKYGAARERVAARMSASQIAQAEKRIQDWTEEFARRAAR